jgi:ribose transport system permease protein
VQQPRFLSPENLINVSSQIAINAFLATGMTFVIITGGIDIGVGSVAAFAGISATVVIGQFEDPSILTCVVVSMLASGAIGALCGLFNGVMIARMSVVPMIATLAMMSVARGMAYVVTGGKPIFNLPSNFTWIGNARLFKTEGMPMGWLPVIVIIMVAVMLASHLFLSKTVIGRHIYAVGSNEDVAFLNGVSITRIKLLVYALSGVLSALGGVCIASKLNSGQPTSALTYEMFAIAAVVLGGTSLAGGKGGVNMTVIGVLTIGVLNNGMNLLKIPSFWQTIVMGLIILLAVVLDQARQKKKN